MSRDRRDEQLEDAYHVCADCGHYVLQPVDSFRCENCGSRAAWLWDTLEEAEGDSQSIVDYNRARHTPDRLRALGELFRAADYNAGRE